MRPGVSRQNLTHGRLLIEPTHDYDWNTMDMRTYKQYIFSFWTLFKCTVRNISTDCLRKLTKHNNNNVSRMSIIGSLIWIIHCESVSIKRTASIQMYLSIFLCAHAGYVRMHICIDAYRLRTHSCFWNVLFIVHTYAHRRKILNLNFAY